MEFVFASGFEGFGEDSLSELLRRGDVRKARKKLREKGRLSRVEAWDCLPAALDCPDELFREVLAACPPGEYAVQTDVAWPGGADWQKAELFGTMPTLAAAWGETEKLRMLLEGGMDGSAAGFGAFDALQSQPRRIPSMPFGGVDFTQMATWDRLRDRQRVFGGCAAAAAWLSWTEGGSLEPLPGKPEGIALCGLTPLAAAVLFGRAQCVRLLLTWPGVRTEASSAVAAAALLAAHGTPERQTCARLVFGLPEETDDIAAALCASTLLPVENVAAFGTADDLLRRLTAPGATEAEARALLKNDALWRSAGSRPSLARKLLTVYQALPALLDDPASRDRLLLAGLEGRFSDLMDFAPWPRKPAGDTSPRTRRISGKLLERWCAAAGPERDISAGLRCIGNRFEGKYLKELLETLTADGGTLIAAAEAVLGGWTELELYALLRKVKFYRSCAQGVSSLASEILGTQSLRLLRFALRIGVLDGEDRTALLRTVAAYRSSAPMRAAILSLPPGEAAVVPLREGVARKYWSGMQEAERKAFFADCQALLTGPVDVQRARMLVEQLRCDGAVRRMAFDEPTFRTPDGRMTFQSIEAAACCADDPTLLRLAGLQKRGGPDDPWTRQNACEATLDDCTGFRCTLSATPLTLAAAAGAAAVVRTLLAEGADPDENDAALRSMLNCFWQRDDMVVTPLAMALWMEQTEAAKILEEAGADRALAEEICRRLRTQRPDADAPEEGADDVAI